VNLQDTGGRLSVTFPCCGVSENWQGTSARRARRYSSLMDRIEQTRKEERTMSTILVRRDTITKIKEIGYWTATITVLGELVIGGIVSLCHGRAWLIGKPIDETMQHLGYAGYVVKILGAWKLLGAIALLVPRFPRLKEWAYAGTFINMTSAAASHAACGDNMDTIIRPLIFAIFTLASWALRPQSRVLGALFSASDNRGANAG
jgi:uncharacterized membrane protein YphA (DoxX/SURF4 family)